MHQFTSPRGTTLTYRRAGGGSPVVCIPGGPLLPAAYLGDLGGLSEHAELVLVDPPGSAPDDRTDPSALRCDRVSDDLEALRQHLGFDRMALLGHSAGANLVLRYAERHGEHLERLLLVAPSMRAVGVEISDAARAAVARTRSEEPWYADAAAALARIRAGDFTDANWDAITPFSYGRWDAATVKYDAEMNAARNPAAAAAFAAHGAFDPPATKRALAALRAQVTVIAGAVDIDPPLSVVRQFVDLFPDATLAVQAGAGHFPWIDDPRAFVGAAREALPQ